MKKRFLVSWLAMLGLNVGIFGQTVSVRILSSTDKLKVGREYPLAIVLEIRNPYHIYSNDPGDEFMVPTEITLAPVPGISLGKIIYPKGELKKTGSSEQPLLIYEKTQYAFVLLKMLPEYHGQEVVLEGSVSYQACDAKSCLPPDKTDFSAKIPIAGADEKVTSINQEVFSRMPPMQTDDEGQKKQHG